MQQRPSSSFFRYAPHVALALLGFAIVLSLRAADPGPRFSSTGRLVDLIADEDLRARILRDQLDDLQAELDALEQTTAASGRRLKDLRRETDRLGRMAGAAEVEGPGVAVELRDSTLDESPSGDPNDLVIHEQDLQAVVNALWASGAEAMAINGERLTSASAVRCVGNTLLLHGAVYAPPYRIEAIGNTSSLIGGLGSDPLVQRFQIYAEEFRLGYDVVTSPSLRLPAAHTPATVAYARV